MVKPCSVNLYSISAFTYLLHLFKEKTILRYRLDFLKLIYIKGSKTAQCLKLPKFIQIIKLAHVWENNFQDNNFWNVEHTISSN